MIAPPDLIDQARNVAAQARQARDDGDLQGAAALYRRAVDHAPDYAPAWNALGVINLEQGRLADGANCFRKAVAADPKPPFAWANLARALAAMNDRPGELAALDEALARDAYFVPAILAKGRCLIALRREEEAALLYRDFLKGFEGAQGLPPALVQEMQEAREWLRRRGEQAQQGHAQLLAELKARYPDADLARAQAYADHRAGLRKVFVQQPTAGFFPYLPAIEFFDRKLFPWFAELERATNAIRDELLSLWAEEHAEFRPYVAYDSSMPVNQWTELNHSPRWSAWFLWENGQRNDANCRRCPATAAAVETLPMLDAPGRGPTVLFSVLQPRTRIPPHTGSTNARTTVHLPLVVPPGCGFRVGAETRAWVEGEAWAFDDTIEHEAWNDSDQPRAILILDAWNPLLNEAERALVRAIG